MSNQKRALIRNNSDLIINTPLTQRNNIIDSSTLLIPKKKIMKEQNIMKDIQEKFKNEHSVNQDLNKDSQQWNIKQILNRKTYVSAILNNIEQVKTSDTLNQGYHTSREISLIEPSQVTNKALISLNHSKININKNQRGSHKHSLSTLQQSIQKSNTHQQHNVTSQQNETQEQKPLKTISLHLFKQRKDEWKKEKTELELRIVRLQSQISLLEIKCERLQNIIQETQVKGTSQEQIEKKLRMSIEEMNQQIYAMQDVAQQEFKNKDKLLIKMYEERTKNIEKVRYFKEIIELKEKEIKEKIEQHQSYIDKILALESQIGNLAQKAESRNIFIQNLKNQLVKMNEQDNIKTLKIEELQTKLQDLERAIRSGKFSKQNLDPIHFQVSLEGFLFKLFNDDPYAISNNIRLGLQLQNKTIHLIHSALENKVFKENQMILENDEEMDSAKYQIIDINAVNLQRFLYGKPKLSMLIENAINQKVQLIFEPPYENWLFLTIRGILDSKYFEMLLLEDSLCSYKSSGFVDFVYSWLGNFCVDKTSKMVRALEFYEKDKADNYRIQLVLGLQASQNLNENLWEYNAFVEFLEDKLTTDEQCYFLHCRNLLFKGPHLKDTAGSQQRMHLLDLEEAFQFVDNLFEKMPQEDTNKLKQRIKSLSKKGVPLFLKSDDDEEIDIQDIFSQHSSGQDSQKRLQDFYQIDQGLLLRILLEYYRREKKIRILLFKRIIDEQPKESLNTKGDLSYACYKKVMEQFDPSLTEIEAARVFRQAFVAGNQMVTFDSIMVVLNEQNFFVRTLQLKGRNLSPMLNNLNDIAPPDNLTEEQIAMIGEEKIRDTEIAAYIFDHWKSNEQNFLAIKRLIENCGQENLLNLYTTLENYIKNKGQIDPAKVRGKNMLQIYRKLWHIIIKFRACFLELNQDDFFCFTSNTSKNIEEVQREFEPLNEFIHLENNMMFDFERQPKGKEVSDAKRSWKDMQSLLTHGYFSIVKDGTQKSPPRQSKVSYKFLEFNQQNSMANNK